MSHKQGRNVTQAGPKCHTRAKMSHSHVIMPDTDPSKDWPMPIMKSIDRYSCNTFVYVAFEIDRKILNSSKP